MRTGTRAVIRGKVIEMVRGDALDEGYGLPILVGAGYYLDESP